MTVPPEELYPKGDGAFEFERTISRLHEMQSEAYIGSQHLSYNGPPDTKRDLLALRDYLDRNERSRRYTNPGVSGFTPAAREP
jgi:hypothetical protein